MENEEKRDLVKYEIDLNPETIDETYLRSLGTQIQIILKHMFGGGGSLYGSVRGTKNQVSSLARALGNEKKYLGAFEKYGLNNPNTLRSRHGLERAIANFERETGIKWPLK